MKPYAFKTFNKVKNNKKVKKKGIFQITGELRCKS